MNFKIVDTFNRVLIDSIRINIGEMSLLRNNSMRLPFAPGEYLNKNSEHWYHQFSKSVPLKAFFERLDGFRNHF